MTAYLRPRYVPEIEGTRLRLHVQRKVFSMRGPEIGHSWLTLCPGSKPDDHDEEATINLPLAQYEALAEACDAFNRIMDEQEQRAAAPRRPSAARNARRRAPAGASSAHPLPAAAAAARLDA